MSQFASVVAPLAYTETFRQLLQHWKFHNNPGLTNYLTRLAGQASYASTSPPDCVVPVPTHWSRRWRRGFDHTWLLAHALAQQHPQKPPVRRLLRRTRATPYQSGLNAETRQANIHKAFVARHLTDALNIALVDDVVTTGATASACFEALINAGARRVSLWSLARVDKPNKRL